MAKEDKSIKRRRIAAVDGSPQRITCLSDLPVEPLSYVANFLTAPSRALFAVAFEESFGISSNNQWTSAIAGNQWDVLDFGEIETELAAKMSDDDIEKVLLCIDAVNTLKRMKLTNCVNITGAGLRPLRGSAMIEQIDLSLVGDHQNPVLSPEPAIAGEIVLPILDSIISREGNLKHLHFPHMWRKRRPIDSEFYAFLGRCNQMWGNSDTHLCLECEEVLPLNGDNWFETQTQSHMFGVQNNTCGACLKLYCIHCTSDDVDDGFMIDFCQTCDRNYCIECSAIEFCDCCEVNCCLACRNVTVCGSEWSECNNKVCDDCVNEERRCSECKDVFCSECQYDELLRCVSCRRYNCHDCNSCWKRCECGETCCAECHESGDADKVHFCTLFGAARRADLATVKALRESGVDVFGTREDDGMSCILIACQYGHIDLLDYLLEQGANPNDKENYGGTCLMAAACFRQLDCVRRLINAGADVEFALPGDAVIYRVAYYFAKEVKEGDFDFEEGSVVRTVELLLEAGAPGNTPCIFHGTSRRKTALQVLQGMLAFNDKVRRERDGLIALLQACEE